MQVYDHRRSQREKGCVDKEKPDLGSFHVKLIPKPCAHSKGLLFKECRHTVDHFLIVTDSRS